MHKSQKGRLTAAEQVEEQPRRASRPGRRFDPVGEYGTGSRSFNKGTGPISRNAKLGRSGRGNDETKEN